MSEAVSQGMNGSRRKTGMIGLFRSLAQKLGINRGPEAGLREVLEALFEDHREELGALSLGPDEIRMLFNILKMVISESAISWCHGSMWLQKTWTPGSMPC